jgi:hypothetical protein
MTGESSARSGAESVLAEFEHGDMRDLDQHSKEYFTSEAVTSPVTISGELTDDNEMLTSFPTSWALLEAIRGNQTWNTTMNMIELATDHGTRNANSEPGEAPERFTSTIGDDPESLNLISVDWPESLSDNGRPYNHIPETADLEQVKQQFLQ